MTENEPIIEETGSSGPSSSERHRETRRKRHSVLKTQRRLIIAGVIFILLLIPALIYVNYIVGIFTFTDFDGQKYKIKKEAGRYAMYDPDGSMLDVTKDGYYVTTKLSTLVEVDPESGSYKVIAVVDTEEGESVGTADRLLMYRHVSQDNTQQIEVHNRYGTFTFYRNSDDDFVIKGYESYPYSVTIFSSLCVSCGYSLTIQKIKDPIKADDGKYHEYGLADEVRKDEDGNDYNYSPSWFRMTDVNGNSYTVYIGDETPSGDGCYVKYTERDAVYIMDYSVAGTVITMYDTVQNAGDIANVLEEPLTTFVTPIVCYPMTATTYFDVRNFMIFRGEELAKSEADESYTPMPVVSFTFWDMDERFGTFYHTRSFYLTYPENYLVNTENTNAALQSFYAMYYEGCRELDLTDEKLAAYGLDDPEFLIYFEFQNIEHNILISRKTENNTRYLTSALYDMIVEVNADQLLFLDYDLTDWVDPAYFDMNIAWATEVIVEADGETYHFWMDNSKSDSMSNPTYSEEAKKNTTISSTDMTVYCSDSKGNTMQSISQVVVTDKNGYQWTVNAEKITVKDSKGNYGTLTAAKKVKNAIGNEVTVLTGYIDAADGTQISVDANYITIRDPDGHSETYLRYGMSMFRKFYQSLLYASLEGNAHDGQYGLSDEKIRQTVSVPDSECQTVITVKTCYSKVPEYVFRYYPYSERRSLITVNGGTAEFYVLRSFTDKIVTDAARVIKGEKVDPISKY
jgi:hypothetical protein